MATSTRLVKLPFLIWLFVAFSFIITSSYFLYESSKKSEEFSTKSLDLIADLTIRSNSKVLANKEYRKFSEILNIHNKLKIQLDVFEGSIRLETFKFGSFLKNDLCVRRKFIIENRNHILKVCDETGNQFMVYFTIILSLVLFLILFLIFILKIEKKRFSIVIDVLNDFGMKIPTESSVNSIFFTLKSLHNNVQKLSNEKLKFQIDKKIFESSRQIAHDIRSPLEALKSISSEINSLDFNTKRIITNSIGRIADIANGLLKSGSIQKGHFSVFNFRLLIEDIVQDKSFEHNVDIKLEIDMDYSSCFIFGNEILLYRSLSNLINNAIECQNTKEIYVNLNLTNFGDNLTFTIEDNGPGMSEELIQKALAGGHTTKTSGNGLGVSYAKEIMDNHKGEINIESTIGKGTKIILSLPLLKKPSWFTDDISIEKNKEIVVCIDDDSSFLELYKEKLKNINKEVITLSDKELNDYDFNNNAQFFFDYDLRSVKTGLDYIIENNLENRSTLVTSMHQDEEIQKRCLQYGIKILPKQIFNNAKVVFVDENKSTASLVNEKIVFIDDDKLMHMSWKMEADKVGVELNTYFSINEFLLESNQYDKKVKIFIDSSLGDGIKGEVDGEEIYKLGFKNIFLATGYSPEDIDKPDWIVKIVGKRPDFK